MYGDVPSLPTPTKPWPTANRSQLRVWAGGRWGLTSVGDDGENARRSSFGQESFHLTVPFKQAIHVVGQALGRVELHGHALEHALPSMNAKEAQSYGFQLGNGHAQS